jgi:hypothetical protein
MAMFFSRIMDSPQIFWASLKGGLFFTRRRSAKKNRSRRWLLGRAPTPLMPWSPGQGQNVTQQGALHFMCFSNALALSLKEVQGQNSWYNVARKAVLQVSGRRKATKLLSIRRRLQGVAPGYVPNRAFR